MTRRTGSALVATLLLAGCASLGLGDVVQAPSFRAADEAEPRLRLLAPSADLPSGGASVRLWARVGNPNAFGINLSAVDGELFLESTRAAGVSFPLGVPLLAGQDTVIPLDVTLGFGDIPRLAELAQQALFGGDLGYRLEGTIAVDAGPLGQPSFGPNTLLEGDLRVTR